MKRTPVIFLVAGLIVLIGVLIYVSTLGNERIIIKDNQLILNNFEYTYDSMVSNVCPGGSEYFRFLDDSKPVTIMASNRHFNEGMGRNASDYPNCVSKGNMMDFYDSSTGLPSGLPMNCVVSEQRPSSFDKPEFLTAKCNMQITFNILNSDKVNSCISGDSCELINGVDVELV